MTTNRHRNRLTQTDAYTGTEKERESANQTDRQKRARKRDKE